MVLQTENLHAQVGRYKSPDEHAFFPEDLPEPMLPPLLNFNSYFELTSCCIKWGHHLFYLKYYILILLQWECHVLRHSADSININNKIWNIYFKDILPRLVKAGDDDNCGSVTVCDTLCLQALSKRIHYGKFVAEAKFRDALSEYEAAYLIHDRKLLLVLLTYETVEELVKKRVEIKARTYGQVPSLIADLYRDWVMPLTKEVQVEYLLRRLD
ncbi:hypothetical protein AAZX31_02G107400 [Glycine max]